MLALSALRSSRLAVFTADSTFSLALLFPGLMVQSLNCQIQANEFITGELWAVIRHNFVWASAILRSDSRASRWRFLLWWQVACPLPRSYCSSQPLSDNSCFWTRRDLSQLFPREATVPRVPWGFLLLAHFKCLADFTRFYLLFYLCQHSRPVDVYSRSSQARFCSHVWRVEFVLHLLSQTSRITTLYPLYCAIVDCQLISQAVVGSCLQGQITLFVWPSLKNQGFHNLQGLVSLGFSLDFF